jgi:hypothetical protein
VDDDVGYLRLHPRMLSAGACFDNGDAMTQVSNFRDD